MSSLTNQHAEDKGIDQSFWVKMPLADKDSLDEKDAPQICVSLRQLQVRRGCSNVLLQDVLDTMRPYLRCLGPRVYTEEDKRMKREAGVVCHELHGCPKCDHIFLPPSKLRHCPTCNHPRYDDFGEPNEVVWYFPIKERLRSLLRTKNFSGNDLLCVTLTISGPVNMIANTFSH